ncbi:MAG: hypothetical protein K0S47_3350 [Herbinix sp.]|jgi:hypothetical protein|nr:hypothetical protein [Herbinix sp.]
MSKQPLDVNLRVVCSCVIGFTHNDQEEKNREEKRNKRAHFPYAFS